MFVLAVPCHSPRHCCSYLCLLGRRALKCWVGFSVAPTPTLLVAAQGRPSDCGEVEDGSGFPAHAMWYGCGWVGKDGGKLTSWAQDPRQSA